MKTRSVPPHLFLFGIVLLLLPGLAAAAAPQKSALVIGNARYQTSPLRNPINDATDMAAMLRKLGFAVTLVTDADQRTMEKSVRTFGRRLRRGGVGLFYYAGHGIQVGGRNYLIPVDAEIETESDVKYEAVDAGRILGKMEDAGNQMNIIILDACRDNPFGRSFRSYNRGLARIDAPSGSILAFATSPGKVAADGSGRNGLYTAALLQHMQQPGVTIERVFKKVRVAVVRASDGSQIPWEVSSLMSDFYFVPAQQVVKTTPAAPAPAAPVRTTQKPQAPANQKSPRVAPPPDRTAPKTSGNETQSQTLASWSRDDRHPKLQLRKDSVKGLSRNGVEAMVARYGFYDKESNRYGNFENQFVDAGNGVVMDKRTGLMWQKGGSGSPMRHASARRYVKKLNKKAFGGYTDWRWTSARRRSPRI